MKGVMKPFNVVLVVAAVSAVGILLAVKHADDAPGPAASETAPAAAAFTTRNVTVAEGVDLEVVDWGGTGRPLVLLAGLGGTAHGFHTFAPKLTDRYHVVGLTRRGFGGSTVAASGYTVDELGDDVLTVIDALQLDRPVLVGHSLAGAEMSSIANRHPEKIAGLVYLDAGYSYAFYDEARGDLLLDALEVRGLLEQLLPGKGSPDPRPTIDALLQQLPQLEKALRGAEEKFGALPVPAAAPAAPAMPAHIQAIFAGQRKFTAIPMPVLAIFAVPHDLQSAFPGDAAARARAEAWDAVATEAQAQAFETGVPSARVVRIAHASHMIHQSHEEEVLREIRGFIATLP